MGNSTQFPQDINASSGEPMDKQIVNWLRDNWHLCLFPTFTLGFGLNFGITIVPLVSSIIAYTLSFSLVVITAHYLKPRQRNYIIFMLPLLFLLISVIFPFPTGAVHHPYHNVYTLIGGSAVSGLFGVLLWFGTIELIRLGDRMSLLKDRLC